jgi:hypothetical protein
MKPLREFLNEGKNISVDVIQGLLTSLGIPEFDKIPNKTVGYVVSGKKDKKLTVYTGDRLSFKDNFLSTLKANKLNSKEITGQSSVPSTVVAERPRVTVVYKPLFGSGGSGAGSQQTAVAETAQAVFISLSFNILKKPLKQEDISLESLTEAYTHINDNDIPIGQIADFSFENKDWMNTFIQTTNLVYSDYYKSGTSYTLERGSTLVDQLYKDYRDLAKEMGISAKDDKWNPADIWLISNKLKKEKPPTSLVDLNSYVKDSFVAKDLVGISLKKTGKKPKMAVYNLTEKESDKKYQGYVSSKTSKDSYILTKTGDKIQFRSFNNLTGFQGEIIGKTAKHGKIGFAITSYFLTKLANNQLPSSQSDIKQLVLKEDKAFLMGVVDKWNQFISNDFASGQELLDYAKEMNPKKYHDWIFSKYLSLCIVETVESMAQEQQDEFVSSVFGFAQSESDFSSVFLKVS